MPTRPWLPVIVLAFGVIALGAFVRLSNAGLGCPDWPGCYGQAIVPAALAGSDGAHARAWYEMIHRYAAALLGLGVVMLAGRSFLRRSGRIFGISLLLLVAAQAMLGMWTVTLRLQPLVVMGHLLGGFALLSLLWIRRFAPLSFTASRGLKTLAAAALAAVILQAALGGWTSANYAALACPDWPACQGQWWPDADFEEGFSVPAPMTDSFEGGGHSGAGRTAIHLAHRIGAVFTAFFVIALGGACLRHGGRLRAYGAALASILTVQLAIGIGNVVFGFPLPMAVAHTVFAALLLLTVISTARAIFSSAT